MKRFALVLVLLALILGACTPTETPLVDDQPDSTDPAVSDVPDNSDVPSDTADKLTAFSLIYNGVRLTPGVHTDVEKALGAPLDRAEAPSCLHDGNDTVYYYEDVEIVTSPSAQGEFVVSVTFLTPAAETEEGIALGDNISDALAVCGEAQEAFGRYLFTRGETTLTMMTDDSGVIVSISYALAE